MNTVRNYQKELDKIIEELSARQLSCTQEGASMQLPRLLLHACCAPCSSYCLEYLRNYFDLTVFYYNPNITEDVEYRKRVAEQKRLIGKLNEQTEDAGNGQVWQSGEMKKHCEIKIMEGAYDPARFYEIAKGLEQCPEGGERCFCCYELRLRESARVAGEQCFDYFTTTLTISPLKNAARLNEIGERLGAEYGVAYLPSDFKKRNGYKRSIELSKEYHLYRQDYCGCVYSRMEREKQKQASHAGCLE